MNVRLAQGLENVLDRLERLSSNRQAGLLFLFSLTLRLSLAIVWHLRSPNGVFPDERAYLSQAREIAGGLLESSQSSFWVANPVFFRPLVFFAEISDRHALLGRSAMACAGSVLVIVVFFLGRQMSPRVGLLAGSLLALYPSQILWSSMYLKDTLSALLLATIALAVGSASRNGWSTRGIAAGISVPVLIIVASDVRLYSALTAAIAVTVFILWHLAHSGNRKGLLLAVAAVGTGVALLLTVAGDRIPISGTGGNETVRRAEYEGAKTLISCSPIPFIPGPETYESGWLNDLSCAPYALRMVLLDPFPNQLPRSNSLIPPFAEQVLWLPLLALALVALKRGQFRNYALIFPTILMGGLLLQWSLIDRVFGTAYRHRTEFIWIVILLASTCLTSRGKLASEA